MLETIKRPDVGKVVAFKLVTGEEIIAKLIEDRKQVMIVSKPISVGMDQTGRVAMMPFMVSLTDNAEVSINMSTVVIFMEARIEMANAYIENTSNIIPASEADLNGIKANNQSGSTGGAAAGGFKLNT